MKRRLKQKGSLKTGQASTTSRTYRHSYLTDTPWIRACHTDIPASPPWIDVTEPFSAHYFPIETKKENIQLLTFTGRSHYSPTLPRPLIIEPDQRTTFRPAAVRAEAQARLQPGLVDIYNWPYNFLTWSTLRIKHSLWVYDLALRLAASA